MIAAERTLRRALRRNPPPIALPTIGPGFEIMSVSSLPAERVDVPLDQRRRAAVLVAAIARAFTPEEAVDGLPLEVDAALDDPLERDEAMRWVDLLLAELLPRPVAR